MKPTHLLFDFFGTLVSYSESRVDQGFHRSHGILRSAGMSAPYSDFLERWSSTFEQFEKSAQQSLDEYSMDEVCEEFIGQQLGRPTDTHLTQRFRDTYLAEWNSGVAYISGVTSLLADLSHRYTLALVTNTHHAPLVHDHLAAMGSDTCFTAVVTSVEHGRRKPSTCIFKCALDQCAGTAETSIYVGDSYAADYLGAASAGLQALLIDSERHHDVPDSDRIANVLELRALLLPG